MARECAARMRHRRAIPLTRCAKHTDSGNDLKYCSNGIYFFIEHELFSKRDLLKTRQKTKRDYQKTSVKVIERYF